MDNNVIRFPQKRATSREISAIKEPGTEIDNVPRVIDIQRNLGQVGIEGLSNVETLPPYLNTNNKEVTPEIIIGYRQEVFGCIEGDLSILKARSRDGFEKQSGVTLDSGIFALKLLVKQSAGNPLQDIENFVNYRKPTKDFPLTKSERAQRVLMCAGLSIIEDALIFRSNNTDRRAAAKKALEKIGASTAVNMHHDDISINAFVGIMEASDRLLRTFRYIDDDSISAIQQLRIGLEKTLSLRQKTPLKNNVKLLKESFQTVQASRLSHPETAN